MTGQVYGYCFMSHDCDIQYGFIFFTRQHPSHTMKVRAIMSHSSFKTISVIFI